MIDRNKLRELAGEGGNATVVVTKRWLKEVSAELDEIGGRPIDILPPAMSAPSMQRQARA